MIKIKYLISNINDYNFNELCISPRINNKINNMTNINRKKQTIIGDINLSYLIDDYNNKIIIYNKYGKPYIKDEDIYFNISHSYDYVISIISNKEIGVDIEKIRNIDKDSLKYFATENEIKYILSSNKDINKRAFEIYTLKEAYFKMLGTNLNNILDIEFNIINNKVKSNINDINIGVINDIDGYIISYCEKK